MLPVVPVIFRLQEFLFTQANHLGCRKEDVLPLNRHDSDIFGADIALNSR